MAIRTITKVGSSAPPGPAGFTDAVSFNIKLTDTNAAPTDAASFAIALALSDSNAGQTETLQLKFPPPDFADSNIVPTDTNSFTIRVWLSASAGTGVTNPANANGQNDGVFANIATAVAGSTSETLTSDVGVSIGTITFSSAIYRGWFNCTRPLGTSTVLIIAHSSSALFGDITMFTGTGTENHNSGDFTFDLIAAGVNTLAKLQSLQILHRTTDVAAGVSPATINVDAGCVEITGVF